MTRERICLIDGDEAIYSIAFRYQKTYYDLYNGDMPISCGYKNKTDAIDSIGNDQELHYVERLEDKLFRKTLKAKELLFKRELESRINSILDRVGRCSEYIICLNGENNFRYEFATLRPYKSSRPATKPLHHKAIRAMICKYFKVEVIDHLESDDTMAVLATRLQWKGYEPIICSSDKDLKTVPGFNYDIGKRKLSYITKEDALNNFYYQILIGDETDTIPKPYGLGEKVAKEIIEDFKMHEVIGDYEEALYRHILPHYNKHLIATDTKGNYKTKWFKGQSVEDVIFEIGNLLYMRRSEDINERWQIPISKGLNDYTS